MKKLTTYIVMIAYLAWGHISAVNASATSLERWQLKLIYDPNESALERENKGFVTNDHGFDGNRVGQWLDDPFERTENMMFTRVRLTDTGGEIPLNPETGMELSADDGRD